MRSAWSAVRSRSLDAVFDAFAKRLLALPTVCATCLGSMSGRRTPRTFVLLERFFSAMPPAMPAAAAAAPTATAGLAALPAPPLTVSTTPFLLLLALLLRRLVLRTLLRDAGGLRVAVVLRVAAVLPVDVFF